MLGGARFTAVRPGVGENRIRPVIMKGKIRMDAGQEGTEPQIREQFFYGAGEGFIHVDSYASAVFKTCGQSIWFDHETCEYC